jgi:asparagine synthase (glutamine-hydrolysing)
MCGIVGSINTEIGEKTLELIKHRGPDSHGLVRDSIGDNDVYLGHTRLSIVDLSEAGSQPMYSDCGNYCISFNGEIYNHLELRKKLKGVNFKGHSDTETILYYIREFGIESISEFNGIFAFGFLDKVKKKLYLARDHFGVKPLYYYFNSNKLVFGSELKVILANKAYNKEIDLNALNTFLSFRYNPAPQTIFKNIFKLKAASYLVYDFNGQVKEQKYWNKPQKINYQIDEQSAIEEYRHLLQQAVKRQLLGDVPIGLLLSGGLDSAVLGYLMSQFNTSPVNTFTLGFEGKGDFNETEYAQETARLINSNHHEVLINKEIYLQTFHKSFYHVEEPIAEPTIPALNSVSALAAKYVKVVMSGQGIDEPMAGYKRYFGEQFLSSNKNLLKLLPLDLLGKIFPRNHTLARGLHAIKYKNDLDRFIGIFTIYTEDLKNEIYKTKLQEYKNESLNYLFSEPFALADSSNGSLSKLLFVDTRTMLPDNLLLFNDKITMANSIENRVPYLDIDLVNFIESLPVSFKLKGKTGKYLHREAVKKWIPNSIIQRKKRGFSTPVDEWFQNELSGTLEELISAQSSFSRIYFNLDVLKKMISDHKKRKRNYKHELFMLLSLELWYKNFYKNF